MTTSDIYREFLKSFPNFESMVTDYKRYDDSSIRIYTKQGKSFIFTKVDGEVRLTSV